MSMSALNWNIVFAKNSSDNNFYIRCTVCLTKFLQFAPNYCKMEFTKEEDLKKKFTSDELNELYEWIDCIPYSRTKKNLARDFCDGVLVAETIAHFFPAKINLKSYFTAHSKTNKAINWNHLNTKILPQFGIKKFKESTLNKLMDAKPGMIEKVMFELRAKMAEKIPTIARKSDYKGNATVSIKSAQKKKDRGKKSRQPTFSKIEMQIENEALAAAKSGVGDVCLTDPDPSVMIKPTGQFAVGGTALVDMEPHLYGNLCVPKSDSAMTIIYENGVSEKQSEKTLQAFDSSWYSYPICNDPIVQVNIVDTNGLV